MEDRKDREDINDLDLVKVDADGDGDGDGDDGQQTTTDRIEWDDDQVWRV